MDFWSRLLSPLSAGTPSKDQAKDPAKRLHRFEKEYSSLLQTWRTSSNLSRDSDAAETLEIRLQELTNILSDETRRPLPHPCIQYSSIKQIYVPIGKIATTSYNEWIIKEAVMFFATLIESEEEAFVENATFAASLTHLLIKITGVNSIRLGLDTESRVVELAFNITTKIRLNPEILPAWFKTIPATGQQRFERDAVDKHEKFEGRTQRADFPLFYILMDYIHHEGKVGDFARTGLLYIIEAASSSTALEQWIVESDLSTLMATGLGALYSQLSRKLVIDHLPHDLPPILALSDYEHPTSNYEIISSCSPEFQSHLETFLSHLLFWQDVLNHCKSVDVKSTLLEHFQVIFLQQLLYPSLLESSDIDGGSSVAVLTYLRRILESLDHPDMINLILHYLLDLPQSPIAKPPPLRTSISDARQRKSMDLATMMAEKNESTVTPLLFNLVDLILACLRSRNQQTIHVTLQLVSAILKRHHRYAVITMLKTDVLPVNAKSRTVGAHEQEVEYLMCLAGTFGSQSQFDETYDNVLKDTMARLETHPCSLKLIAPRTSVSAHLSLSLANSLPGAPRDVREHILRHEDPLLNAMLDILETFFINPIETNLSVTETIVNLAVCGYMSIDGWLARNPLKYEYDDDEEEAASAAMEDEPLAALLDPRDAATRSEEAERMRKIEKCRRRPQWVQSSVPRILDVLKKLADQVVIYKTRIPRFEELVQQRWEAFQTADALLDQPPPPVRKGSPGPGQTPDRPSLDVPVRSGSPAAPGGIEGFAQRLLSELGTPNRAASPAGSKREQGRSSGTVTPARVGHGLASPRIVPVPPKDLPPLPHEHGRGIPRTQSPTQIKEEMAARLQGEVAKAHQLAANAAIDQSILARKVGLPDEKLQSIPINFDKKQAMPEPVLATATKGQREESSVADTTQTEIDEESDDEEEVEEGHYKGTNDSVSQARTETTVSTTDADDDDDDSDEDEQEEKEKVSVEDEPEERPKISAKPSKSVSKKARVEPQSRARASGKGTPQVKKAPRVPNTPTPAARPKPKAGQRSRPRAATTSESEAASTTRTPSSSMPSSPTQSSSAPSKQPRANGGKQAQPSKKPPVAAQTATTAATTTEDDPEVSSSEKEGDDHDDTEKDEVSVSHLITNVIIYQSFLFELASLLQVRAGLFDEVRYI